MSNFFYKVLQRTIYWYQWYNETNRLQDRLLSPLPLLYFRTQVPEREKGSIIKNAHVKTWTYHLFTAILKVTV